MEVEPSWPAEGHSLRSVGRAGTTTLNIHQRDRETREIREDAKISREFSRLPLISRVSRSLSGAQPQQIDPNSEAG
jgi:hypothetical protein